MSDAFSYRPKFIDVRVRPPRKGDEPPRAEERRCDHADCARKAECRCPKSPKNLHEHYWFCTEHAGEYNRAWNFFAGMSETEFFDWQEAERIGHRTTFPMGARGGARESFSAAFRGTKPMSPRELQEAMRKAEPTRQLTRAQRAALEEMDLKDAAEPAEVRAKYTELVKRFHPDSNGGDRSRESKLHRVIKAYQLLKASGLA